jgi:V/A-type H+/Na+-transporting ATPase subunit E
MSDIKNLINKVLKDAEAESNTIIEKADQQKNEIINRSKKEAEVKKNEIIDKAKLEAQTRKDRVISNAELQVRNNKLEAKQNVIDNVFENALVKLKKLSDDKFLNFVKTSILSSNIDGDEEIIVSNNYKSKFTPQFVDEINASLKQKGKNSNIKLSNKERNIKEGFILDKKGIELNFTFEDLINSIKEDIESDVVKILFE